MRYLHSMVRVKDLEASLKFYVEHLGMTEVMRKTNQVGRFTLVYLTTSGDKQRAEDSHAPLLELTYNWDTEHYEVGRGFGHLAFEVDDIYEFCLKLQKAGIIINRPPRDGRMAFIKSPDNISIELLQKGEPLAGQEPWVSMPNIGTW